MGKMGYVKRSKAYDGAYKRLRGSPRTQRLSSIRLRRSRSNTSTEYSLPGATQLSQARSISPSGLCELPEHETPADPRHFGRSAPRGGGGLCVRPLSTTPTPSHSLTR